MICQTRFPKLWAELVGPDSDAEERLKAAKAVAATCEALRAGA